jgi:flagellar biogenesis protein FliO
MEMHLYVKALLALVFVLLSISLLAFIIRKFGLEKKFGKSTTNQPSLSIKEAINIDHKNKLVLVQHHEKTHLLLIGTTNNIVIDSNIKTENSTTHNPDKVA